MESADRFEKTFKMIRREYRRRDVYDIPAYRLRPDDTLTKSHRPTLVLASDPNEGRQIIRVENELSNLSDNVHINQKWSYDNKYVTNVSQTINADNDIVYESVGLITMGSEFYNSNGLFTVEDIEHNEEIYETIAAYSDDNNDFAEFFLIKNDAGFYVPVADEEYRMIAPWCQDET